MALWGPFVLRNRIYGQWPYIRIWLFECKNLHLHVVSEYTVYTIRIQESPSQTSNFLGQLFGPHIFRRTLPTQSASVWNHSHTKTFERADFNLFTRQTHLAASIDNSLTWCPPTWHVGGKVAHVFAACELPHKNNVTALFIQSLSCKSTTMYNSCCTMTPTPGSRKVITTPCTTLQRSRTGEL